MSFGDSVIDDIVRLSDENTEHIMKLFYKNSDKIEGDTWSEKIDTLNKCKCCQRHNINKPSTFQVWHELPSNFNQDINCKCNCRHMARMICRIKCGSIDNN